MKLLKKIFLIQIISIFLHYKGHNFSVFCSLELLLGVLHTEDVSASGEALLYCVATFKFLSGNTTVLKVLLEQNFIAVVQTLIQKLCEAEEVTTAGHILVQVSH